MQMPSRAEAAEETARMTEAKSTNDRVEIEARAQSTFAEFEARVRSTLAPNSNKPMPLTLEFNQKLTVHSLRLTNG